MPESARVQDKLIKRLVKRLVLVICLTLAMWAPIQGAYAYIAGGKLAWLGITTSRDLPHLLFLMSVAVGCWIIFFLISFVLLGLVALALAFLAPLRRFDAAMKALFWIAAAAATLSASINTRGFLSFWDAPDHGVTDIGLIWAMATVGALLLAFVYVVSFLYVQDLLKELKKEGAF